MNTSDIRARLLAVLVGVALFVLGAMLTGRWLGNTLVWLFVFDIAGYGIAGLVLGLVWPSNGWKLGLYLSAILVVQLLLGAFLAWEQATTAQATLQNLLGYFLVMIAACFGTWCGAWIRRRAEHKTAAVW